MWVNNEQWVYWDEQCKFCKNNCDELYKNKLNSYLIKLKDFQNRYEEGIYGILNYQCGYFIFDCENEHHSPEGVESAIFDFWVGRRQS